MILGVESTAHTFGIGIVNNGKILVNVKDSYTTNKGGIIPLEAAKHHREVSSKVLNDALEKTGVKLNQIKAIAFSQGPGLSPCLIEGKEFALRLAKKLKIPLIPVNHCIAHQEIGKITGAKDAVMLYASGANTQIIAYASGKYRVFGETLDIGVGNFIDTFARYAGLGFPGGPKIAEIAEHLKGEVDKENLGSHYIELPYSIKGMDVSFSGLLTKLQQMLFQKKFSLEDLSYSLQETAFAMLVEASERALAHTGKKELILAGGVACNRRLQEMAKIMCEDRGAKCFIPSNEFLVDNGGMIAYTGEIMFKSGIKINIKEFNYVDIKPKQRTDDVEVSWR